jgi:hypothetical protein
MLNLKSGVYNIESEQVEALINVNALGFNYIPAVYRTNTEFALWIKNDVSGELTIVTGNKNIREIRNAITALLSN